MSQFINRSYSAATVSKSVQISNQNSLNLALASKDANMHQVRFAY